MSEIRSAVVKSYDADTHKADVQIAGSLAVWLDAVRVATNIPAADVVSGRQCTALFLDPSNQDDAVIIAIQGAAPSTGSVLVASATSSLTLTGTAQSIVGDGDSTKVRILLPTPGDWLIEAVCDFHVTAAAAGFSAIGELFLNDSGSAESGAAIKEQQALDRATVAQRWKVTTTAADTPVELKARKDGGSGTVLASAAHTRLTATGPSRSSDAIPAASGSVVSETNFGQAAAAGSATPYSRGDHTHGTPADPVTAHAAIVDAHAMLAAANTWAALNTFSAGIDVNGVISMTNGSVNRLEFGTAGFAAPDPSTPSNTTPGMKVKIYGADGGFNTTDYAIGLEANYMWFNSDTGFKFYKDAVRILTVGPGGQLTMNSINAGDRIQLYTGSGETRWGFAIEEWQFVQYMDGSQAGTNGKFSWQTANADNGQRPSEPTLGTPGVEVMAIHTDGTLELPLGMLCFSTVANLTIATGAVTATRSYHTLTAQSGTTDDLDTISVAHGGPEDGSVLVLRAVATHTITVKDGTGNLDLGSDVTLVGSNGDTLTLIYDGTNWNKIAASTN